MKYFRMLAQKVMGTSGYQLSILEDIKFHWEDPDLNMDAVFRPGKDTLFPTSTFHDFELVSMAEIRFPIDQN